MCYPHSYLGRLLPQSNHRILIPPSWSPKMDHLSPSLGSFYWNWKGRAFVYYLTRRCWSVADQMQIRMLNSSQYVCFLTELVGKEVLLCRVKQREREHPDGVETCDPSLPRAHIHPSLIRWSSKLDPGMQLGEEVRELEQQEPDPQGPEEGISILFWGQREDIKAGA